MTATSSTERLEVSCQSCGATITFEAVDRSARCAWCDSPNIVDRPATSDRPDPVFAIGFTIDRTTATDRLRRWLAAKRWAPAELKKATADHVRGVYAPAYLYSAAVDSGYGALIGEDYIASSLAKRTPERRTELRPLQGQHSCYLGDVLVTASAAISDDEFERLEPFDLRELRRFTPALVSGWPAEEPSVGRDRCLELARREALAKVRRILLEFMPGDSCRGINHNTAFRHESLDLTLVPVWVFALRWRDDRPPVRLLVNGQTGDVTGAVPRSWRRIATIVLVALGWIALLALVLELLQWLG